MTPTRTRRIATATAVMALAGGLSACLRQPTADPSGASAPVAPAATAAASSARPSVTPTTTAAGTGTSGTAWAPLTVAAGDWQDWKPVLTDLRPATDDDVADLQGRAGAATLRDFTATVESFFGPAEYAHRTDHARLRFGAGGSTALEVHIAPLRPGEKGKGAFGLEGRAAVLCLDDECVRVTGDEAPEGKPHLFDNLTDSALMQLALLETSQEVSFDLFEGARREGYAVGTATVESPVGVLDCAVAAETSTALRALDGEPLDLRSAGERTWTATCVDARGLVVVTGDIAFPLVAFHDFRPGTDADIDSYPAPVKPYGA